MYLHYWHFENQWYMFISEYKKERVSSGTEKYLIQNSQGLTKKQIKEKLSIEYPNYILVKEIIYHEGNRWFGNKKGSRI